MLRNPLRSGLLAALLAAIAPLSGTVANSPSAPDERLSAASCAAFGFDFYSALNKEPKYKPETDSNIAFSPFSLASVLEVLRSGASGTTEKELANALHQPAVASNGPDILSPGALDYKGVTLAMGNSLWPDQSLTLEKDFTDQTEKSFGSVVFPIDFSKQEEASAKINGWISDHTEGHITDLLTPDDMRGLVLGIANAIYFKGTWATPFDAKRTLNQPFHLASGSTVSVPTMQNTAQFQYAEVDGVQFLSAPYAGNAVSMVFILPKAGAQELDKLSSRLTEAWADAPGESGFLDTAIQHMKATRVLVSIPRFTFKFQPGNAIAVLETLGIKKMFTGSAEFEKISKTALYVTLFRHRAWLEVNEQGTEAAAATFAGMTRAMARRDDPLIFLADHPFLFVIRHNATGTPLFIGRVSNPAN